jgi:serine/threonine protein kinase
MTAEVLPRRFGHYLLLKTLGIGGMGVVYKARHQLTHRIRAVKTLRRGLLASEQARRRFRREARAATSLAGPNVVTVYEAGEWGGILFLAMEYVDGRDLASVVREHGPFSISQAISYTIQTARGLAVAHGHAIVHRDVKPSNLLVDRMGCLKILDLGLARIKAAADEEESSLTEAGQIIGTLDFMAPEQVIDARHASVAADIYGLGCTFYYLVAGKPPFGDESLGLRLDPHRDRTPPSLQDVCRDVPAEVDSLFFRMLAKRPEDRPSTMDEIVSGLEPFARSLRSDHLR